MIDPEFWSDEEIATLSFPARLFYIGLWNFADDEGKGKGHSKLLKAQIFPYDDKINIDMLKKEVSIKVEWYKVNNQQYYYLPNFLKHQRIDRPTASKLPDNQHLAEHSSSPRGDVLPNIIEVKLSKDKVSGNDQPKTARLSDIEFIKSLKSSPAYKGIDIDRELSKMDVWITNNPGRQKTRKFVTNWLNKIDAPLEVKKQPTLRSDKPYVKPEYRK